MHLKKELEDELRHKKFISLEALDRCIRPVHVKQHLQAKRPSTATHHEIVSTAPKLFALLVLLGQGHAIEKYLSSGFCDKEFPVWDVNRIPDIGCTDLNQELYRKQWDIPPVLYQEHHLDLPLAFVPPFLDKETFVNYGSFGLIHKVRVAKGHLREAEGHGPQYDLDKELAWKQITKTEELDEDIMMREVETLRDRRYHTIIPLLASWSCRSMESERVIENLNLLYPFAEMDMETWMIKSKSPDGWRGADPRLLKDYICDSIMSLSDAVAFLHKPIEGLISSHHDLKPSNILLYGRTWKIADFGRTHLIRLSAGSSTEGKTGLGTFTYQPPEYFTPRGTKAHTRHGRAFDIWALGCISLELLTIAVYGWSSQKIRDFRERRRTNPNPSTQFIATMDNQDISFHNNMEIVKEWILELRSSDGSPNLTAMLKIVDRMLDTKPHSRPLSWEIFLDLYELRRTKSTPAEKALETKNRVQEPNRHREPCKDNPLQRAVAARNTPRVEYLLKAGWSSHLDILRLDDECDEQILRRLCIAKVMRGIQWRRYWKIALKAENSKPTARNISPKNHHQVANHGSRALTTEEEKELRTTRAAVESGTWVLSPVQRQLTDKSKSKEEEDLQSDEQGMTKLHRLCKTGHVWRVQSFLERRSPEFVSKILTCKDKKDRLPLHYVACNGRRDLVELLLGNFNLDTTVLVAEQDSDGRTPLHLAALHGHQELLEPLVRAHIDRADYLEMKDHGSLTAYDLARGKTNTAKTAAALANLKQSLPMRRH